jgi:hypothetical protein
VWFAWAEAVPGELQRIQGLLEFKVEGVVVWVGKIISL